MLILLYGPDSFRRVAKKRDIVSKFKERHPQHTVEVFDMDQEESGAGLAEFVRSASLFDPAKMAVLDNFSFSDDGAVRKFLRTVLEDVRTTIVISSGKKPPQKDWGFLLKKPVLAQEFEYRENEAWEEFLADKAKEFGVVFSEKGLKKLAHSYSENTWGAMTEIGRLAGLAKTEVGPEDIGTIEGTGDFFQLALQFKNGSVETKIAVLEKLLSRGERPEKIFFVLASLLPDKKQLASYDAAVKSGKMDFEEALLSLALQ